MKRRIGVLLLSVILVVGLVSCGKGDIAEGTWELAKAYSGESEVSMEQLQEQGLGGTTFTFEDGKVTIKMTSSSEESEGNYKVEGDAVTITGDNETGEIKGTIKDNQLTIADENSSIKMVFERK